jgi:hypothetical protein
VGSVTHTEPTRGFRDSSSRCRGRTVGGVRTEVPKHTCALCTALMHVTMFMAAPLDDAGGQGGMQGGMGLVVGVGGMGGMSQGLALDYATTTALEFSPTFPRLPALSPGPHYLPHEQELGFIEALLLSMMQHLPNGPLHPAPNPKPCTLHIKPQPCQASATPLSLSLVSLY